MSTAKNGLTYILDDSAGIQRIRRGKAFVYRTSDGKVIQNRKELERIRVLAIPPAWTSVWICPRATGHLQATGRDARGRKQYRYHASWRQQQDETKYHRLAEFGTHLKGIRRRINRALRLRGLPREKVLAAAIRVLDLTGIRVGNAEYAVSNGSFGLTTLRDRHVQIHGESLRLQFRGKSGLHHALEIQDARLARILRRCSELPGQLLFQYLDQEGHSQSIQSADINDCLQEWTKSDFTAKDFRTWAGSVHFLRFAAVASNDDTLVGLIKKVAAELGNTQAICRKYYIHPTLIEGFEAESLTPWIQQNLNGQSQRRHSGLQRDEVLLLKWLRRRTSSHSRKAA